MNLVQNPARTFLARVVAWPQEGEQQSYVNIHNMFMPSDGNVRQNKKGVKLFPMSGRAARSLDEAMNYVDFQKQNTNTRDLYFCTSTQTFALEQHGKNNRPYYKAVRSQENVAKLKSLFIDSDLKAGEHGYASVQEFKVAFADFIKNTGLPRPTIMVSTGGGFHLYWTLARPLTLEQWMPLAYALAEATRQHGFKCDTQCTIDGARILRIPQTKNFKYDPPRDVTLLGNPVEYDYANEKIEAVLAPYKVAVPYSISSSAMSLMPPKAPLQGVSDLASGIDLSGAAPIVLDSLIPECLFIAEALTTGGSTFSNPLWNLTTLVSTFTEGGRTDAHRMASGHADYSQEETDELFDRKTEERLIRDLGWPQCAAINGAGFDRCKACVHFPEHKSLLNFGKRAVPIAAAALTPALAIPSPSPQNAQQGLQAAQAQLNAAPLFQTPSPAQPAPLVVPGVGTQDPDLPTNYLRDTNGFVLYMVTNEDGTTSWLPIARYPMTQPWMTRNPWELNFTTMTEHGRTSQIIIPLKDVGSSDMRKVLQEQGFMVGNPKHSFVLAEFFMAWITKLQATKDSVVTSVPFGWLTRYGKIAGFVYAGKLHTPTGEEVAGNTDPELSRQFSPEGDVQPWRDASTLITDQRRPELDIILAAAFAAPLVRFTGHSGLLLSAYSIESGLQKSTAMKVSQAVWGDPVKGIQSLSDTQNSVLNKVGELRSLPIFWDELKTEEDSRKFVDTVFRLSLGKEKSRMTAKVTQKAPGTWQTMMVAASNDSLMDSIASKTRGTTAGLYRVFEYVVSKPTAHSQGQIDPTVAQRIVAKLHDNYGNIGKEYAAYLGMHHTTIERDMGTVLSNIAKEVQMQPDERFWVGTIACLIVGAELANGLGFTDIDIAGLKKFLLATLRDMRQNRSAQPIDMRNVVNVVAVLARFLNENRARHTLVTNIIHRARGKAAAGSVTMYGNTQYLDAVKVHIGKDDRTIRIGQAYLQDWLTENKYPRHVFMKAMELELGAKILNGKLGAGTIFTNAAEYLVEIDVSNTPLLDYINDV